VDLGAFVVAITIVIAALVAPAAGEVLFFTSPSCGPCQGMKPLVHELASQGAPIVEIDISRDPEAARVWNVRGVPTFIAVSGGREADRVVGACNRIELTRLVVMAGGAQQQQSEVRTNSQPAPPWSCRISARCADGSGGNFRGTGQLVYKDATRGVVLTCWHTFRGATDPIVVSFPDGTKWGARLLAVDSEWELGALEIRPPRAEPVSLADRIDAGPLTAGGFGGDGRWRVVTGALGRGADKWNPTVLGVIRSGDSGGPVLTRAGTLAGVLWGNAEGEIYFCHGQPLRRFLDRVLPGRPAAIVPHATWERIAINSEPSCAVQQNTPPPSAAAVPPPVAPAPPPQQTPASGPQPSTLDPRPDTCCCNCGPQLAAMQAQITALGARLSALDSRPAAAVPPAKLEFTGPDNKLIATAVVTPGQTSRVPLPPLNVRVLDPRGAGYSTDYQPAYLGQYVTLPFGPAN
jgi:S1-C subfamily serine protease